MPMETVLNHILVEFRLNLPHVHLVIPKLGHFICQRLHIFDGLFLTPDSINQLSRKRLLRRELFGVKDHISYGVCVCVAFSDD
jgi:hypothetical protein